MPLYLEDALLEAVAGGDFDQVRNLLEAGADPNARLFTSSSALAIAIQNGKHEILEHLLQYRPKCCLVEVVSGQAVTEPRLSRTWSQRAQGSWKILHALSIDAVISLVLCEISANISGLASDFILFCANYAGYIYSLVNSGMAVISKNHVSPIGFYVSLLMLMSTRHQLNAAMLRHFFGIRIEFSQLPVRRLSYFWDLVVAVPIEFVVGLVCNSVYKIQRIINIRKLGRWSGPVPDDTILSANNWKSPAEIVLTSLLETTSDVEPMALAVLSAGLLVQRPYRQSKSAGFLLPWAIVNCYKAIVEYLLHEGAIIDEMGQYPLPNPLWPVLTEALSHISPVAARRAALHLSLVEDEHPAQIDRRNQTVETSALISLVTSKKFLKLSADDEIAPSAPLCCEMMDLLVVAGVDPNCVDQVGRTALSYLAQQQAPTRILSHLVDLPKISAPSRASHVNALSGQTDYKTPLHFAVDVLDPNVANVVQLLKSGIPVNTEAESGETALYAAAHMNSFTSTIKVLLENGADPNYGGRGKCPPLFRAVHDVSEEKFTLLLSHGADANIHHEGDSILILVMKMELGLGPLLRHGALAYVPERGPRQPLLIAASEINGDGWKMRCIDKVINAIPHEQLQSQLNLALQAAAVKDDMLWLDLSIIFHLLARGADPTFGFTDSKTLLHHICATKSYNEHSEDLNILLERALIDVNACDEDGRTALHYAVDNRSCNFVLILLQAGASAFVNVRDLMSQTPLNIICSEEVTGIPHTTFVELLKRYSTKEVTHSIKVSEAVRLLNTNTGADNLIFKAVSETKRSSRRCWTTELVR
jgi:ankyrin repeat protein